MPNHNDPDACSVAMFLLATKVGRKEQRNESNEQLTLEQTEQMILQVSSDQKSGYLLYMRGYTTQLYRDYFISHYKDPYKPTSTMECHQRFDRCSSN